MTTRAADDVTEIAKHAKRLRDEREMATDIDKATGEWLDLHGRRAGVTRGAHESDYAYRNRIKAAT
jgi:hypothetical protein